MGGRARVESGIWDESGLRCGGMYIIFNITDGVQ